MRPICIGARLGGGPARPATSRPADAGGRKAEEGGAGGLAAGRKRGESRRRLTPADAHRNAPGVTAWTVAAGDGGGGEIVYGPAVTGPMPSTVPDDVGCRRRSRGRRRSRARPHPYRVPLRIRFTRVTRNPPWCCSAARHWPGRPATSHYWRPAVSSHSNSQTGTGGVVSYSGDDQCSPLMSCGRFVAWWLDLSHSSASLLECSGETTGYGFVAGRSRFLSDLWRWR